MIDVSKLPELICKSWTIVMVNLQVHYNPKASTKTEKAITACFILFSYMK